MYAVISIRDDGREHKEHPCLLSTQKIAEEVMKRYEENNKARNWVWKVKEVL